MELALLVYVLDLIPKLYGVLWGIMILTAALGAIIGFLLAVEAPNKEERVSFTKWFNRLALVAASCLVLTIIIPGNKSTLYTMVGAYATQTAVTSDTGKRIVQVLEAKITKELDDIEKEIKK